MEEYKNNQLLNRKNRVKKDTKKDQVEANDIFINDEELLQFN